MNGPSSVTETTDTAQGSNKREPESNHGAECHPDLMIERLTQHESRGKAKERVAGSSPVS